MRIIYLSPDMSKYGAAFYQQDVIEALHKRHELYLYGPGFPGYDLDDSIDDILSSLSVRPDLICVGHGWLVDNPEDALDRHPRIDLSETEMPKAMILNKEYARLEEKLEYIVRNKIDIVFTHHHDTDRYSRETEIRFIFWPFAVNPTYFRDYGLKKIYDLTFTGILRNPTFPHTQADTRIRVQRKLFYCVGGELRLLKRPKYRNLEFFWSARPSHRVMAMLSHCIHGSARIPSQEYFKLFNKSRICFNALSPLDLVSPRYYESMASKCLVFCPRHPVYEGLFKDHEHCVMFEPDLCDFDDKLFYYLKHDAERQAIVECAYRHVRENHTWEKRVQRFTEVVRPLVSR